MINYRKIKVGIIVILGLAFISNLFLYFTETVSSGVPLTANAIVLLLPALLMWTAKHNTAYLKMVRRAKVDVDFKFLENRIGYQIVAETIMSEFQGILVDVDKDWLKIKDRGMGNKIHILKSSMITFIIIK